MISEEEHRLDLEAAREAEAFEVRAHLWLINHRKLRYSPLTKIDHEKRIVDVENLEIPEAA